MVQSFEIVGRGHNRREIDGDPLAHAEILAIRQAAEVVGNWRLTGCSLYVTLEPCTMCCGAILLSRVGTVVFGAADPRAGAVVSTGRLLEGNPDDLQQIVLRNVTNVDAVEQHRRPGARGGARRAEHDQISDRVDALTEAAAVLGADDRLAVEPREVEAVDDVRRPATDPTGSGDGDVLIIGDLNAYDKEDTIDTLTTGGYTDLVKQYQGEDAYSYVFDGQLGYLDHALANPALTGEISNVTIWHINADEADLIDYDTSFKKDAQDAIYAPDAFRSSDHDPVIVGLELTTEAEIMALLTPEQAAQYQLHMEDQLARREQQQHRNRRTQWDKRQ